MLFNNILTIRKTPQNPTTTTEWRTLRICQWFLKFPELNIFNSLKKLCRTEQRSDKTERCLQRKGENPTNKNASNYFENIMKTKAKYIKDAHLAIQSETNVSTL